MYHFISPFVANMRYQKITNTNNWTWNKCQNNHKITQLSPGEPINSVSWGRDLKRVSEQGFLPRSKGLPRLATANSSITCSLAMEFWSLTSSTCQVLITVEFRFAEMFSLFSLITAIRSRGSMPRVHDCTSLWPPEPCQRASACTLGVARPLLCSTRGENR